MDMCIHVCLHVCVDARICICIDTFRGTCIDTCMDMCMDACVDTYVDTSAGMCLDMRHRYGHGWKFLRSMRMHVYEMCMDGRVYRYV